MLEALISSKTRIKLLMRLFLNPGSIAYLRGLAEEFEESTNAVRLELNRFEEAGMITSESQGNKKLYKANNAHPLFRDINSILLKYIGVDQIIEVVIERMGELEMVYMTGDYARGKDSGLIDLIFIGEVNKEYLVNVVEKAENLVNKKIRYLTYDSKEWERIKDQELHHGKTLLLWQKIKTELELVEPQVTTLVRIIYQTAKREKDRKITFR
jgi:DNA-binding transcriptional ArsR family regulator